MDPRFPNCYKVSSKPHKFCPGCGHPIILKMLAEAIDEMAIAQETIFLIDIGCSLLAWDYFDIPTSQTHHGRTVPVAVGFKMASPEKIVIAYVGDGGGYAIGLQHTLTASLRNDPITTIVVNNTLYAMTGGQMAPTTVDKEVTATTPSGKSPQLMKTLKGPELLTSLAAQDAYLVRGSTNQPLMLKKYLKKALSTQIEKKSFSLVEAVSACPLNWKANAQETIATMENLEKEFNQGEFK